MLPKNVTIWTNRDNEEQLRKIGFNVPMYPIQGEVLLGDKVVGYMDNFNGLTVTSKTALLWIEENIENLCIWNKSNLLDD